MVRHQAVFFLHFNKRIWTSIKSEAGQVSKGAWWMPRHQGPKKGVARLRKASVSCQASLAGDTRMGQPAGGNALAPLVEHIGQVGGTGGTETSKYPKEEKSTEIPRVVASERGRAQTVVA